MPRKTGLMTSVALDMGYKRVMDIPTKELNDYSDNLVNKFGVKRSKEMLLRQIIYRKNIPSPTRNKFVDIYEYIRVKHKNEEGVSDIVKSSGTEFIKGLSKGMGLSKGENK
jgi:hypothetical protein